MVSSSQCFHRVGLAPERSESEAKRQRDQDWAAVEAARRSPEGFRELFDRYFERVRAYAAYRVPCIEDADDLTAQVFLKVVEALPSFTNRGDGSFAAWLFRIAHNCVIDFHRRSGTLVSLDALAEMYDGAASPDHALMQQETFERLRRSIGELPQRQQEIITLKFFAGLRNKDIAHVFALDERTVAAHLCRGLKELYCRYVESHGANVGGKHDG